MSEKSHCFSTPLLHFERLLSVSVKQYTFEEHSQLQFLHERLFAMMTNHNEKDASSVYLKFMSTVLLIYTFFVSPGGCAMLNQTLGKPACAS